MTINEAASILRLTRDEVKVAINDGIELPISRKITRLATVKIADEWDIDDAELDAFILAFENEEPSRHPPVAVARALLVEARYACLICLRESPLEFHHLIEWSKIKHYDVQHMMAICPTCHTKCTRGDIDRTAQKQFKHKVVRSIGRDSSSYLTETFLDDSGPIRFSWDDLRSLIGAFHGVIAPKNSGGISKYDFDYIDLEQKNRMNNLGSEYFDTIKTQYEPYFGEIFDFLKDPRNEPIQGLYHEIVDELRLKIAAQREKFGRFEDIILGVAEAVMRNEPDRFRGSRRIMYMLLCFMYVNCDIGKK